VMIYEALAGVRPEGAFPTIHQNRPEVPVAVDAVLLRLLQPDPIARFANAEDARLALLAGLTPKSRRRRLIVAVAGAAGLLLVAGGGLQLLERRTFVVEPPKPPVVIKSAKEQPALVTQNPSTEQPNQQALPPPQVNQVPNQNTQAQGAPLDDLMVKLKTFPRSKGSRRPAPSERARNKNLDGLKKSSKGNDDLSFGPELDPLEGKSGKRAPQKVLSASQANSPQAPKPRSADNDLDKFGLKTQAKRSAKSPQPIEKDSSMPSKF
jgi:hypothetical protein